MSFMYLVALPAILSELIVGRGPDEDKDEQWWSWAAKLSLAYPFMTVVGLRDVVNHMATGYSYQATPVLDAANTLFADVPDSAAKLFDPEKDWDTNDTKNVLMGAGYLFKLPSRQLYISGEHLYSVLDGEEDFSLYELMYRNKKED
jgi:hypothetical protein